MVFVVLYTNGSIDPPGDSENVPYEFQVLTYTLSMSFGDMKYPKYSGWMNLIEDRPIVAYSMVTYIYAIYWLSTYVMLIMMLNFIIAIMGQKYEEIRSTESQVKIIQMTEMIEEALVHKTYEGRGKKDNTNKGFAIIFSKKIDEVVDEF